jgi:hypothetical protein
MLLETLKDELVRAIPIDPERLEIYQKVQNEYTDNQVLISATIKPSYTINSGERNTMSVLNDLDELIKEKKYNIISNGNITKFLDSDYGAVTLRKYILIISST